MAAHRFTVNVPNRTARSTAVQLLLERMKGADLMALALDVPEAELEVVSAGITLDPCDLEGRKELEFELAPFSSVNVHVLVATAPSDPNEGGAVAFHMIDRRGRKLVGGVLLACVDRLGPESAGLLIGTPNPCPAVLGADAYPVAPGDDPSKQPASKAIPIGTDVELVAPITNPTGCRLDDVQVYLEHLGGSDAQFTPVTWNVGTLSPGGVFFAIWPLYTYGWMTGIFEASVVIVSQRTDPVRLHTSIQIGCETGHEGGLPPVSESSRPHVGSGSV